MFIKQLSSQNIVQYLLFFLLLTPLVYLPWIWRPAQTSKFFFFIFIIEIVFFIAVSLFKSTRLIHSIRNPIILSYGIYILFVVVSSIFGVDPLNSFFGNDLRIGGWLLLIHTWIFCVLLLSFFDSNTWKRAENIFVFSSVVVAFYALMEYVKIFPSLGYGYPRALSIMGNPIYLAGFLIFPLMIALKNVRINNLLKNANFYSAIILFFGIFVSGTRGAFLGIIIGGIIGSLIYIKQLKNWKKIYITFGTFLTVLFVSFFIIRTVVPTTSFYHRFFYFSDSNVTSRFEFWKMALKGFPEHLIMGVGYENFYRIAEKNYSPILYESVGNYSDKPHNAFIEILVSSGIVGLTSYFVVLFLLIRSIYIARKQTVINVKQEVVLVSGLIAYLIQNFFAFDTIGTFFTFSFFIAYISFLQEKSMKNERVFLSPRKKNTQRVFIICSILFFGLIFLIFFQPSYRFFSRIAKANNETDEVNRFQILQSIDTKSFVYDRNALGRLYLNGAKTLYGKVGDSQLVKNYFESALEQFKYVVKNHPNRGEYWYQRADMGLMIAFLNKSEIDQDTKIAVEKAIELTPTRTEPYLVKATEMEIEGKIPEAIVMLETVRAKIPNSNKLLWTLSVLYGKNGEDAKSAELGYQSITTGLKIAGVQSILDLINYFADTKEYDKVIQLYIHAITLFPEQVDLVANLAAAYAANGQIDDAIETAKKYEQLNPSLKVQTDAFIQSLQGSY